MPRLLLLGLQENLRWACDRKVADRICSFNRHYAEVCVGSGVVVRLRCRMITSVGSGVECVRRPAFTSILTCVLLTWVLQHRLPHVSYRPADATCALCRCPLPLFNYSTRCPQYAGYWLTTSFLKEVDRKAETTYYDSVTGLPLFIAPRGRTFEDFEAESRSHGWPSFRDEEVVW